MTAPRTAIVPVEGGGVLVMPCPSWCTGHDSARTGAPSDFHHAGPTVTVTVDTPNGPAEVLHALLAHYPLSIRPDGAVPYVAVQFGGDGGSEFDPAGLYALAAELADRVPAALRQVADQLAQVLADFPEGSAQ